MGSHTRNVDSLSNQVLASPRRRVLGTIRALTPREAVLVLYALDATWDDTTPPGTRTWLERHLRAQIRRHG